MTVTKQKDYAIKLIDNILHVQLTGPFSEEIVKKFDAEINLCIEGADKPWASLTTYCGNGVFTADAEQALIKMIDHRIAKGMVANASIIQDSHHTDVQQMQLHRVYSHSDIPFHVFSDPLCAKEWLEEYLNEQKHQAIA